MLSRTNRRSLTLGLTEPCHKVRLNLDTKHDSQSVALMDSEQPPVTGLISRFPVIAIVNVEVICYRGDWLRSQLRCCQPLRTSMAWTGNVT